tara:strand:- start:177 stop:839 length:663 start_codon:yes stop_codon:yes gene_type:complete
MNAKSLSGYLIAIGPILMMATWFFIWPALIGEGAEEGVIGVDLIKANIEQGMDNIYLTTLVATLGGGAMLAMMLGFTLWARSLQGEGKKGTLLATIASITIPVAAAGFMLSMEFNFAAGEAWANNDVSNALIVGAVGEYIGSADPSFTWTFVSLSLIFIGIASFLQSNDVISKTIAGLFAVIVLITGILNFTSIDADPLFMLWMLANVAAGINLIRLRNQ